jgi:hypothetical protein
MGDNNSTARDGRAERGAWVHEAVVELDKDADPRAVGAAVTVALCGHWEHEGPCRWPHNNAIVDRLFRTLFVCEGNEKDAVRARISAALHGASDWRVVSERARAVADDERVLAQKLLAVPRRL